MTFTINPSSILARVRATGWALLLAAPVPLAAGSAHLQLFNQSGNPCRLAGNGQVRLRPDGYAGSVELPHAFELGSRKRAMVTVEWDDAGPALARPQFQVCPLVNGSFCPQGIPVASLALPPFLNKIVIWPNRLTWKITGQQEIPWTVQPVPAAPPSRSAPTRKAMPAPAARKRKAPPAAVRPTESASRVAVLSVENRSLADWTLVVRGPVPPPAAQLGKAGRTWERPARTKRRALPGGHEAWDHTFKIPAGADLRLPLSEARAEGTGFAFSEARLLDEFDQDPHGFRFQGARDATGAWEVLAQYSEGSAGPLDRAAPEPMGGNAFRLTREYWGGPKAVPCPAAAHSQVSTSSSSPSPQPGSSSPGPERSATLPGNGARIDFPLPDDGWEGSKAGGWPLEAAPVPVSAARVDALLGAAGKEWLEKMREALCHDLAHSRMFLGSDEGNLLACSLDLGTEVHTPTEYRGGPVALDALGRTRIECRSRFGPEDKASPAEGGLLLLHVGRHYMLVRPEEPGTYLIGEKGYAEATRAVTGPDGKERQAPLVPADGHCLVSALWFLAKGTLPTPDQVSLCRAVVAAGMRMQDDTLESLVRELLAETLQDGPELLPTGCFPGLGPLFTQGLLDNPLFRDELARGRAGQ